jgi:hypothetical protein
MNRILKIHTDDILVSSSETSSVVNLACSREQHPMKVVGMVACGDVLIFTLEETETLMDLEYVISKFPVNGEDDIIAEIDSRFFAGFSTISGFDLKGEKWALFVFDPSAVKK